MTHKELNEAIKSGNIFRLAKIFQEEMHEFSTTFYKFDGEKFFPDKNEFQRIGVSETLTGKGPGTLRYYQTFMEEKNKQFQTWLVEIGFQKKQTQEMEDISTTIVDIDYLERLQKEVERKESVIKVMRQEKQFLQRDIKSLANILIDRMRASLNLALGKIKKLEVIVKVKQDTIDHLNSALNAANVTRKSDREVMVSLHDQLQKERESTKLYVNECKRLQESMTKLVVDRDALNASWTKGYNEGINHGKRLAYGHIQSVTDTVKAF